MLVDILEEKEMKNFERKKSKDNEKEATKFLNSKIKESETDIVLHNIDLQFFDSNKVKIDHLLITKYGIFIIDSKFFEEDVNITITGKWKIKNNELLIPPRKRNKKIIPVLEETLKFIDNYTRERKRDSNKYIYEVVLISDKTKISGHIPDNVVREKDFMEYINKKKKEDFIKQTNRFFFKISNDKIKDIATWIMNFSKFPIYNQAREDFWIIMENERYKQEDMMARMRYRFKLTDDLLKLREKLSKENNEKPYFVFSRKEIDILAKEQPKNKEELLKIESIDRKKIEKYGDIFLEKINEEYKWEIK